MTRIVFLDIDGVLLSRVNWFQPGNADARDAMRAGMRGTRDTYEQHVQFSASAIALVNRLCELSSAQLVLSSSWRSLHPVDLIRHLLVSKGVCEAAWHPDCACPVTGIIDTTGTLGKRHDIEAWLSAHPDVTRWVALDDDAGRESLLDIGIDGHDGLTVASYRLALRLLTGEGDPVLGPFIPPAGLTLLDQHGVSSAAYEFAWWLEFDRADEFQRTPSQLLGTRYGRRDERDESEFMSRLGVFLTSCCNDKRC